MNNDTTVPKGITALIYRDALGTDFSNRGISARVMEVTVIGEGIDPVFEVTAGGPPPVAGFRWWLAAADRPSRSNHVPGRRPSAASLRWQCRGLSVDPGV
jgi:hypothetical protein